METVLIAGTLRPDLIESASELASGKAAAIKTHHNDTELVRELRKQVRHTHTRVHTHTHTHTRFKHQAGIIFPRGICLAQPKFQTHLF